MKKILIILFSIFLISCNNDFQVKSEKSEIILSKTIDDEITSCISLTNVEVKNNSDEFIDSLTIISSIKIIFKNDYVENIHLDEIFLEKIKPDSIINFKIEKDWSATYLNNIFNYEIDYVELKFEIFASNKIGYKFKNFFQVDNYNHDFKKILNFQKNKKFETFEDVFYNYSILLNKFQKDYNRICKLNNITNELENNNLSALNQLFRDGENYYGMYFLIKEDDQEWDRKNYGEIIHWITLETKANEDFIKEFNKLSNKYLIDIKDSNSNISNKFNLHFKLFKEKYISSIKYYIQLLNAFNKNYKYNYNEYELLNFRTISSKIIKLRNESAIEYSKAIIQLAIDNKSDYVVQKHYKILKELENSNRSDISPQR